MGLMPTRRSMIRLPTTRRRWWLPLVGGLILPLDPLLGVALVVAGLWAGQRRRRPSRAG